MSGLQPFDKEGYPCVAGGDEVPSAGECYDVMCRMPPSGEGPGVLICEHEHITAEGEFCTAHWIDRKYAQFRWSCTKCYGIRPDGDREKWGHLCPMTIMVRSERMSA
jgi:hypothetical protein